MEQEMKYIYTVYQKGSFSKAAAELFLTQPALSLAVARVESRIGMPLFDRTSMPLKLTPAGEYYIQKYHEIYKLECELNQQISDLSSLSAGSLRIGGTHYFNAHVLPPVLTAFSRQYPGISLRLIEAGADSLLQLLHDHDIDLTFHCGDSSKDTFLRTPCFTDTLLISVPLDLLLDSIRDYALSSSDILQKKHLNPDCPAAPLPDFSRLPFITLTSGNDLHRRAHTLFREFKSEPDIKMEVRQLVTAWQLSKAGMGAAFIPDFLIDGSEDSLAFFRLSSPLATRHFDLVMSDRHYISRAMTAFSGTLRGFYQP